MKGNTMRIRPSGQLHYAWIVAAVTFITLLGASGFRSTPGVLIVPLQHEFGWSRATISLAVSINLVLFGFSGPFAAAAMERFGMRRVMLIALLAISAGSAPDRDRDAGALRQLYLLAMWGVVVRLARSGSMATVLGATVANRWFVRRRGLVLGILTASSATGQLIFLPLLAWLAVTYGWRWAAISVAIGALLVWPLVAILKRNRPEDNGLRAYGADAIDAPGAPAANPITAAFAGLRIGVRSRDFWFLAGSFFICGATTNGLIGTHLIPAAMDHGVPEVTAASLLAVIGVFDIIGTTASGWLTDRMDSRLLLFWYYALRGLSLLYLPYAFGHGDFGLIVFIVFYGLDWVATVPPTVALTREVFGKQNASIVFGWIFAAHQLGAAFTIAAAAGAARTWFVAISQPFCTSGPDLFDGSGPGGADRSQSERGRSLDWGKPTRPANRDVTRAGAAFTAYRGCRSKAVKAGLLGLLLILIWWAMPAPVFAHANLQASNPSNGAVLTTPPKVVLLGFSQPVQVGTQSVIVLAPSGKNVARGPIRENGSLLSMGFSGTAAGTYLVRWSVISYDTHPATGSFVFSVGRVSGIWAGTTGGSSVSSVGLGLQILAGALHNIGYALGFGPFAFVLLVLRRRSSSTPPITQRFLRMALVGTAALLVAELLAFLAQMTSLGTGNILDSDSSDGGGDGDPVSAVVLAQRLGAAFLLWALIGLVKTGTERALPAGLALGAALGLIDAEAKNTPTYSPTVVRHGG